MNIHAVLPRHRARLVACQVDNARDRHGFRASTIDTKPNGDRIHRDRRGFVTGRDQRTLGGDTILRDGRGQAVGRIEGPLPGEARR